MVMVVRQVKTGKRGKTCKSVIAVRQVRVVIASSKTGPSNNNKSRKIGYIGKRVVILIRVVRQARMVIGQ